MELKVETANGTARIALSGRLDTNTSSDLDDAIFDCIDDVDSLDLDFAELEFVSSAGLRVLMRALDAMEEKGGGMVVRNVCENVMEVFEATALDTLFDIR